MTRNSAAAVVTTLMLSLIMQLLGIIAALDFLRPYLLPQQFNAWQGLLREPIDWAPDRPRRLGVRRVRPPLPRLGVHVFPTSRRDRWITILEL